MNKVRLDVETLVVESFDTVPAEKAERGTVLGHARTDRFCQTSQICPISDDDPTCMISCGYVDSCPQLTCGSIVVV